MAIANQIQGERLPETTTWVNKVSSDSLVMAFPDVAGIIGDSLQKNWVDEIIQKDEGGF